MTTPSRSISVIVPVYNEALLLEQSIQSVSSFIQAHFNDYEIIIIESGSVDGSYEICDRLMQTLPNMRIVHEGTKSGFGSALKLGYQMATKDLVWLVVVDLPFPLETILVALPFFDKCDCVFSYRGQDDRGILKRFRSYVYNLLVKMILRVNVKHINSAFRVYKRKMIQSLPLISTGWTLDAEVIYEVTRRKIKYVEIPVPLFDRTVGQTTVAFGDPFTMIVELIKIVWKKKEVGI